LSSEAVTASGIEKAVNCWQISEADETEQDHKLVMELVEKPVAVIGSSRNKMNNKMLD
jgi:hypothetical protein